jgi:serine phosphatase RsbU (regulator of sigma subunit)
VPDSPETHPGAGSAKAESDDLSRRIRAALLPRGAPGIPGFDVAAGTATDESDRGGSAWDWLGLPDGRVALVTLDVREGGLLPAHHIGVARAVLRGLAAGGVGVPSLLAKANEVLSDMGSGGVTQPVEVGLLVVGGADLEWGGAGQVPAGLIRRDGAIEELGANGPPLGMMGGFRYTTRPLHLGAGDAALVISHTTKGLFQGAAELVARLHSEPAGEVVTKLHRGVRRAGGDARSEVSVLYARKH